MLLSMTACASKGSISDAADKLNKLPVQPEKPMEPEEPEEPVNPADTLQKYADDEIKIMSFNVRLATTETNPANEWPNRKEACLEMIMDHFPTLIGLQEAKFSNQWLYFKSSLKEFYGAFGVNRDTGYESGTGETMGILYNLNQVELITSGTFWLSETPDTPSKGWDAQCYRTATWALMKDKRTGKKFYYVNTHLDHKGAQAQKNGLALIVERIAEMNPEGLPMVLTGDFNVTPDNPVLTDLNTKMKSAQDTATKTDDRGTFNGWGKKSSKIDYIYYSGFSACPQFEVVTKKYADRTFISDHFPITAVLVF